MQIKEGSGWKAGYNEESGKYGAEVMFQGSWELYEISADIFARLSKNTGGSDAEELIRTGRKLCSHVNDNCGPPYTVVLDDDYAEYCPWAGSSKPVGRTWSREMTDAAELFESQKDNRGQGRRKREGEKK